MPATESLTIEIQGDSSGLSQALDDSLARVQSLQAAADAASNAAGGIGGSLATVSTALQPLQQVGQQLGFISQQAFALSQHPIMLNVQPALSALQMLMGVIQEVAAELSAISMMGPMMGPSTGPSGVSPGLSADMAPSFASAPTASSSASPSIAMAAMAMPSLTPPSVSSSIFASVSAPLNVVLNGFTSPNAGSEQLSLQQITSPTWMMNEPITAPVGPSPVEPVRPLGTPPTFSKTARSLNTLLSLAESSPPLLTPPSPVVSDSSQMPVDDQRFPSKDSSGHPSSLVSRSSSLSLTSFGPENSPTPASSAFDQSSSTINHFGGITIEVRETADVNALMRDLRLQGLATRHRQG